MVGLQVAAAQIAIKRLAHAIGPGKVAADRGVAHINAIAAKAFAQGKLAAKYADRAGQGRGLGDNGAGMGCDPITARCGIGAHRDHNRLARRLGRTHRR